MHYLVIIDSSLDPYNATGFMGEARLKKKRVVDHGEDSIIRLCNLGARRE